MYDTLFVDNKTGLKKKRKTFDRTKLNKEKI